MLDDVIERSDGVLLVELVSRRTRFWARAGLLSLTSECFISDPCAAVALR
jgi:hypothetical protein